MPSFNDYVKNSNTASKQEENNSLNMLKQWAGKYEGMSESELIKAIVKEAEKNRAEGKLTNADLDGFKNLLLPMLNSSQAKKLDKIIEKLKAQ